eukprot:12404485-Karenia_brevis.AAC.1
MLLAEEDAEDVKLLGDFLSDGQGSDWHVQCGAKTAIDKLEQTSILDSLMRNSQFQEIYEKVTSEITKAPKALGVNDHGDSGDDGTVDFIDDDRGDAVHHHDNHSHTDEDEG